VTVGQVKADATTGAQNKKGASCDAPFLSIRYSDQL
jgi:hypothetical protein